jgi:hypothetical protein
MKRTQKSWLWLVIVVLVTGFAATAPRTAGDVIRFGIKIGGPPAVVYHYTYYPDAEVYFDPVARLYWWTHNGVWVSGAAVPAGITLGAGVNLDVDEREPWHHHHDAIVHRYPHHYHHHD